MALAVLLLRAAARIRKDRFGRYVIGGADGRLRRGVGEDEEVVGFDGSDGELGAVIRFRPDEASPAGSSVRPFLPDWDGPEDPAAVVTAVFRVLS